MVLIFLKEIDSKELGSHRSWPRFPSWRITSEGSVTCEMACCGQKFEVVLVDGKSFHVSLCIQVHPNVIPTCFLACILP